MKTIVNHRILKAAFAVFLLTFLTGSLCSQNIIRLKNGNEFRATILSQTRDTLTYLKRNDRSVTWFTPMTEIDTIKPAKPWRYCTGPLSTEDQMWKKVDHYQRSQGTGIGLLASGLSVLVVGAILFPEYHHDDGWEELGYAIQGTFSGCMMAIGSVGIIAGTVILVTSSNKMKQLERQLNGFSFDLNPSPQQGNLTVRYRF